MAKNHPESYKEVLAEVHLDGLTARRLPHFHSLFARFNDTTTLDAAQPAAEAWK